MPTCFGTTPDCTRLLSVLRRQVPDRVPVYEFFSDTNVQMASIGDWPMEDALPQGDNPDHDAHIRAQYYLGYDYVARSVTFGFSGVQHEASEDSAGNVRYFLDGRHVAIAARKDFEDYPWPLPESADFSAIEYCAAHLPEGMGLIANLGGGLLEWGMWLMGAEQFCLAIYDDPDLVRDILARICQQQVAVAAQAASHPAVMACALGDDMGFKTQTFLPPRALREFVFPGLKRVVDAVHAHGKPFILHSCGNLTLVMDDLIEDVGIDAKHSFEDVIMPIKEVKARWGSRTALLGGVDVDALCRLPERDLRAYVRDVVDNCARGGGFAVGSGNSIANYIPPRSLRVMLEEALRP